LAWIEGCLDLGVTSFDHADIYGGYRVEELFGEALALSPGARHQALRQFGAVRCAAKPHVASDEPDRVASAAPRAAVRRHARSLPTSAHPPDDLVAPRRRHAVHERRDRRPPQEWTEIYTAGTGMDVP